MDVDLLKSFLAVKRSHHFGRAAEELFVTQAAVSARIKRLEQMLGAQLFKREARDVSLTAEGHRLVPAAERILAEWRKAEQEVAFGDAQHEQLAVAGLYSMWDFLLQDWLNQLCEERPELAVLADALHDEMIVSRVLQGILDIGFVFEPPLMEELREEPVATTTLLMVASEPGLGVTEAMQHNYVYVDWGVSFDVKHAQFFPGFTVPQYRMGRGRMAKAFITANGGAAYLTSRTVREGLDEGSLFIVEDAPRIERTVFALSLNSSHKRSLIEAALESFSRYATPPV